MALFFGFVHQYTLNFQFVFVFPVVVAVVVDAILLFFPVFCGMVEKQILVLKFFHGQLNFDVVAVDAQTIQKGHFVYGERHASFVDMAA